MTWTEVKDKVVSHKSTPFYRVINPATVQTTHAYLHFVAYQERGKRARWQDARKLENSFFVNGKREPLIKRTDFRKETDSHLPPAMPLILCPTDCLPLSENPEQKIEVQNLWDLPYALLRVEPLELMNMINHPLGLHPNIHALHCITRKICVRFC